MSPPVYGKEVLRLPPAELRALQDSLLRDMVEICYEHHPFYSQLMRREKLEPRHLQSCDDLVRLPPSSKTDFLADPEAFRIRPDGLPAAEGALWKVIYTTGTTSGRPAPVFIAGDDHFGYMHMSARSQDIIGMRSTDVIANLFPLTSFPMGAYSRAADEAAAIGATIVNIHPGRAESRYSLNRSLDEAVEIVARHRATVLVGIAGFVRRVLMRAHELGADFSSVRLASITGEAASDALLQSFTQTMERLGCAGTRIVNRYGSTEQGSAMVECVPGSGFHALAPDHLYHETLDAETGRRCQDGETGMLAFTHLQRRGTAFLRYLVGDQVTISREPCPHCGRTAPRITSQPVRTGDLVKIKGTLVNLQTLKDSLESVRELIEYQIVVQRVDAEDEFSADELLLRVALAQGAEASGVTDGLVERASALTLVRPRVEIVAANAIYDPATMGKPRRVVDLRHARASN